VAPVPLRSSEARRPAGEDKHLRGVSPTHVASQRATEGATHHLARCLKGFSLTWGVIACSSTPGRGFTYAGLGHKTPAQQSILMRTSASRYERVPCTAAIPLPPYAEHSEHLLDMMAREASQNLRSRPCASQKQQGTRRQTQQHHTSGLHDQPCIHIRGSNTIRCRKQACSRSY
jgi:hypothetical protein